MLGVLLLLIAVAHWRIVRVDLTDDGRYSLSAPTRSLLQSLDSPLEMDIYLGGELNVGFRRLQQAVRDLSEEMQVYADITTSSPDATEAERMGLTPTVIHERAKDGRTAQTMVYPYMRLSYKGRHTMVNLLRNTRGLSGEQNLNASIENLEYAVAEALQSLQQTETPRIAFLEGHGELPEANVLDISKALNRYFQIDRGVLGTDIHMLDDYKVIIVADPQEPFSEQDKYIIDQYIMRGGRVLWVLNGVRFSSEHLADNGYTPVLALDLNLTDMLFRYGVRVNPALVQDIQCLPIPVNVSADDATPNFQPTPWYYAPLLLTSQASPITRNLGQVSSTFASVLDLVGEEDGLQKDILLATSSASRLIGVPAEVDLVDLQPDFSLFRYQYVPVAVSVEGEFRSLYAHRMTPAGLMPQEPTIASGHSRQVVVASGSIIRNEWQAGEALPVGYDRYSQMQFANRDFLVNAILYLADNDGLMTLRQREVTLRLLNDKRAHDERKKIQLISTILPLLLLMMIGGLCWVVRQKRYK